ncbi:hypothetical protein [Microvirga arabica]|uniref:hypothetical protein n=1 Tax=Microvirga arabica TaxID=1128671 RepID=UPI001939ED17|nr:hypothetical protein [Microvirga arabica]MBM1170182.1 hypothetical protein [Microvirga arabica]
MSDPVDTKHCRTIIDNYFRSQMEMESLIGASRFNLAFKDFRHKRWTIEEVYPYEWILHAEGIHGYPDPVTDGVSTWEQLMMREVKVTSCDGYCLVFFWRDQQWSCWLFSDERRGTVEVAQAEYDEHMRIIEEAENCG